MKKISLPQHIVKLGKKSFTTISRKIMGTITHVSTQSSVVALTFDDGPDPKWTPQLLDILNKHKCRATFFVIGKKAQDYPGIIRRVAEAGHTIGNHSWDHPFFPLISRRERKRQILLCANAIGSYGQKLFRPPYGHEDLASHIDVFLSGYQVIAWSFHVYDWEDNKDPKWIAAQLENGIKPGRIILLHDGVNATRHNSRKPMLDGLEMFLRKFSNQFRFVTIPELFQHGHIERRNLYIKPDRDYIKSLKRDFGYDFDRD